MIIYIDENMPRHLALGFQMLQSPENLKTGIDIVIEYLPERFEYGAKDIDWIPIIGENSSCVITQDINITRRKNEIELYKKHKVGLFIIRSISKKKGMTLMEMIETLAKNWETICSISTNEKRPFAFEISKKGKPKKLG